MNRTLSSRLERLEAASAPPEGLVALSDAELDQIISAVRAIMNDPADPRALADLEEALKRWPFLAEMARGG